MYTILAVVDGELQTLYNPLMASDGYAITSGTVTLELGKAGSAEITIPRVNPLYDRLAKLKTVIQVMNDDEELFCGRILHDTKDFNGNKELYIEGNLAYLIDRICPFPNGYSYNGSAADYFHACMSIYNSQTPNYSTLEAFHMAKSRISPKFEEMTISFEEHEYVTFQDAIYDKIVENCGGYLKTRFLWYDSTTGLPVHTLDYVDADDVNDIHDVNEPAAGAFHNSGQKIEFGENLLDLSEYISAEDTFTVLVPLGKMQETEISYEQDGKQHKKTVNTQRIDISGVVRNPSVDPDDQGQLYVRDPNAQAIFGNIWKTIVWDEVTDPNELYGLAHQYLGQYNHVSTTLTINAVDLGLVNVDIDKIHIGDYVELVSWPHGYGSIAEIDAGLVGSSNLSEKKVQCISATIDLLNPGSSEYTFESGQKTISEMQSATASNIDSVKTQMSSQTGSGSVDGLESRVADLEESVGGISDIQEKIDTLTESVSALDKKTNIQTTELTTVMDIYGDFGDLKVGYVYLNETVTDRPGTVGGTLAVFRATDQFGSLIFYGNDGKVWTSYVSVGELQEWKQVSLSEE